MNKKKRRRKRKPRIIKSAIVEPVSPLKRRESFPNKLVEAYIKLKATDWSDKAHKWYVKQAKKYLGNKFGDTIECCKLIVLLYKATMDINYVEEEQKKEEQIKED